MIQITTERKVASIATVNVENDKDVVKLEFTCPNQVTPQLKLTDCDKVYINYSNADVPDRYLVTDLTPGEGEQADIVTFSWLLGRNAVHSSGSTFFVVCAQKLDAANKIAQEWNTELTSFKVHRGLETLQQPVKPYEDIFSQIFSDLAKKLIVENIIAGNNVTLDVSGNNITINAEGGGSVEVDEVTLTKENGVIKVKNGGITSAKLSSALNTLINGKAEQYISLYTPTSQIVNAETLSGKWQAAEGFTLRIGSGTEYEQDMTVNKGDVFYIVVTGSPYCTGYVDNIYFDFEQGESVVELDLNSLIPILKDFDVSLQGKLGTDAVKQTTGTSQTDVMSQKAVTDAINGSINPELLKFVSSPPSSNIDTNAYYLRLNTQYFPSVANIPSTDFPVVFVTYNESFSDNKWRMIKCKPESYGEGKAGVWGTTNNNAPYSFKYAIYTKNASGDAWTELYAEQTNNSWASYMGVSAADVSSIGYSNYDLGINSWYFDNMRYRRTSNRYYDTGNIIDTSSVDKFQFIMEKYVNNAWVTVGNCDFEELLKYYQNKPITVSNITIATSAWEVDNTYTGYGYKADISISGVTASMVADVYFSGASALLGTLAPFCDTGSGKVTIYCSANDTAVTVDKVVVLQ